MGDVEDAQTGSQQDKVVSLTYLQNQIQLSLTRLLSTNISKGLSWEQYFACPGPNGRVWPDGTVVWWAEPVSPRLRIATEDALYLEKSDRHVGNQLWGKHTPRNGDSTVTAFRRLKSRRLALETLYRSRPHRQRPVGRYSHPFRGR